MKNNMYAMTKQNLINMKSNQRINAAKRVTMAYTMHGYAVTLGKAGVKHDLI